MWRKEDGNPQASPEVSPNAVNVTPPGKPGAGSVGGQVVSPKAPACISQGIKIKGEVTGTEDLFVDGSVEGKITLANAALTVGPNGAVKAEINARDVILRGRAEGTFTATERIQIWHTARVHGELKSERISIEDGAELRGRVEAGKAAGPGKAGDPISHAKKAEHGKPKDVTTTDAGAAPGAASAGAD